MANTTVSTLPPDLFDQTTLISLASTVAILAVAYGASLKALSSSTSGSLRFLFIWHAFDALTHFILEGSFLYHCFFSWLPVGEVTLKELQDQKYYNTPHGFLGHSDRIYGSQAGGENPFAQLWMVYARADKRWAGVDLGVVSLELLTVFIIGPLACLVCYDIAKKNPRANIVMTMIATAELYGGFMTFCPEWLTGNQYLDTSNFMYKWVYLIFFNVLWVFIPIYALYVASGEIMDAFKVKSAGQKSKKTK
ncbi:putative emopamil binding protein [Phaeoacremonium minimum UCRPA7]|uniref:Putative emopamil binding protein n=1 Tax=Phaeoacremonium minimum (strain UCR-PA7) TaxID=1286976 RepID=R8BQ56_PHAM7|nr:putative emopamil binding protein [Phaeoacremonium minimum UCRPA7]EOO01482.1 putative emopamil binding protein [Phaeoacremonium minimum UCRPA7]